MNRWTGSGFVTKDPDSKTIQTKNGEEMAMVRFSVACQRKGKDAGADFINCVAFGKIAETISKYIKKGSGIEIEGHIQTGSYEGKNGKVYTTDVIVENMEFPKLRKNEVDSQTDGAPQEDVQQTFTNNPPPASDDGFMNIPEGLEASLPFR